MRIGVLWLCALSACSPSESIPTACVPACASNQVCVNAQCLVAADGGADVADVPAMDAAPDAQPDSAPDVAPDVPTDNTVADVSVADGAVDVADSTDAQPDAITCPMGFADCDGMAANGCEVDTQGDWLNCGTCRRMCPSPFGAGPACSFGACAIVCDMGAGDCDGNMANGCETLLNTSAHCGSCSNNCGVRACVSGACR